MEIGTNNKHFEERDVFSNNRNSILLSSSIDIRTRVDLFTCFLDSQNGLYSSLFKKPEGVELNLLEDASNYSSMGVPYYDCRDWAFDNVGLYKYSWREGNDVANKLRFEDLPDIQWIPKPERGSIVMYFNLKNVTHWGIVDKIEEDIYINSKWGEGHIYNHTLDCIPMEYGNYAEFFRVHQ
ncbi:hypothetical protein KAS08_01410 [Candidatus Pacearchaeota archaeon]|nr:hypothetical protein [Candidatus Pacearchaeota archaeon]